MDFAHLEKMGRELNCPICLSLLKSAVTLACNHVFCNSCIVETMRSASNCPICKVPFRRREVRPAAHMDNLVSIYKSMEATSGLTIFTSQVAPPKNSEESYKVVIPQTSLRRKRMPKGIRKKRGNAKSETSNPCSSIRPSFSSSKRIHVTPYPVSETPIPQKKVDKLAVSTNEDVDRIELGNDKNTAYKWPDDSTLQPFFWLSVATENDEVLERMITQEMSDLTTPKLSPCFSDIKDSDDGGTPKKMTPINKPAAQEAFDSEMFDWTQRACSPELFSTPLKKQNIGVKRFHCINHASRGLESLNKCNLAENRETTRSPRKKGTLKKRLKQNKEKKVHQSTCEISGTALNEDHWRSSNEMVGDSNQEKEASKELGFLKSTRRAYKNHNSTDPCFQNCSKKRLSELNELAEHKVAPGRPVEDIKNKGIKRASKTLAELSHDVTIQEGSHSDMNQQKCCASSRTKELLYSNMNGTFGKCKNAHSLITCDFCHSSNDLEFCGEIMHYYEGKLVAANYNGGANVIHSHKNCTEWAPDVYFKDDLAINLSSELSRSRRITCSCCGIKGAALGCFEKSCRRSFHYLCAKRTPKCRWDYVNFVMLCPSHPSAKLPSEMPENQRLSRKMSTRKRKVQLPSQSVMSSIWAWPSESPCKWVFCSSALSGIEKEILTKFAKLSGVSISKNWSSSVTHIIASTDENKVCKRTLKFLMGILNGQWILSIEWIKACMKSMSPVEEEKYEVTIDVHGIVGGPRRGRMRIINQDPKLFAGLWFYLFGCFATSYKGYLQDLITAAGGKVLHRRPISREHTKLLDNDSSGITFIVYSLELPKKMQNQDTEVINHRKDEAMALAKNCWARVVTNSWILDSIAASTLQAL